MYYAIYASSTTGTTGCVKRFCASPLSEMAFPPNAKWDCPLCNIQHNFRFDKVTIVDTPKRTIDFIKYCEDNSIDMNIELSL